MAALQDLASNASGIMIEGWVGGGAFGSVLCARDNTRGASRAVKSIRAHDACQGIRELNTLRRLCEMSAQLVPFLGTLTRGAALLLADAFAERHGVRRDHVQRLLLAA